MAITTADLKTELGAWKNYNEEEDGTVQEFLAREIAEATEEWERERANIDADIARLQARKTSLGATGKIYLKKQLVKRLARKAQTEFTEDNDSVTL